MTTRLSACVCLVISSFAAVAAAQPQYYTPQVQPKHSTMFGIGWEAITDNEFADMASGLLVDNGNSNARGAMFLFEQCFSGGMFGELATAFSNDVRWVGGSAARHDESSWGEGDDDPFATDFWTSALQLSMQENDTMIETVNLARLLDQYGPSHADKEHPQSIYRNGGQTINHRSLGASSHNAILWAGNANGERHVHDIQIMYSTIRQAFIDIGEPYNITVLGDSGQLGLPAQPATKANLQAAFDAMQAVQDPNSDFLFYASDHGGTDSYWQLEPFVLASSATLRSSFLLSEAEIQGLTRTRDAIPQLVMRFEDLDQPGLHVFLEDIDVDVDLGDPYDTFDRHTMTSMLPIDPRILSSLARDGRPIQLRIDNETDSDFTLLDGLFRTGGIDNVIVPEPATMMLLGWSMLLLICRRRWPV
jgi:hypothetical protein